MKTTLLALTGVACLATSGIAMVAADRGTTSGAETSRAETETTSDLDRNERESVYVRQQDATSVEFLDISRKGFLSANDLPGYTTSSPASPYSPASQANRNHNELDAKLESPDSYGEEFRQSW